MNQKLSWLAALLVLLCSHGVEASSWEEAQKAFTQAEERYAAQDFSGAIEQYAAAYRAYPDPAFLFNLAQCYRRLGDFANAAILYERYLGEVPEAPNRNQVEQTIFLLRQEEAEPLSDLPDLTPKPPPALSLNTPEPGTPLPAPTSSPKAGLTSYWWFWSVVGGSALIATGGVAALILSGPGVPDTVLGHQDAFQE